MSAWWSAAFPGFGHVFTGLYVKGFILIIWEVFINQKAGINTAIIYSFIGRFDLAKDALDKGWLLMYCAVYVYAIWDSYRSTVDLNKFSILADREKSSVLPFKVSTTAVNYLDKRPPWTASLWSALLPGLGQLCTRDMITGFFIGVFWITLTYYSRLLEAIHYTFAGAFRQAVEVTDPQLLLYLPSLYVFTIYHAYVNAVENNKMFDIEQAQFLKKKYQNPNFVMPV